VNWRLVVSYFKDWRNGSVAGGSLLVGFLVGLLIFGAPWHLPADWGDVPTWLLALFALIGGWVGLYQLHILREQFGEEVRLNAKRDGLMDKWLAEAKRRSVSERRVQAEDIVIHWSGYEIGVVENSSRRPISRISCKVMSNVDQHLLRLPDECGERVAMQGIQSAGVPQHVIVAAKPLQEFKMLRPEASCAFSFKGLADAPDQVLVAWFTDDAGFRWQLDEYLHLVDVKDAMEETEYRQ
jgi:hypothetical protein